MSTVVSQGWHLSSVSQKQMTGIWIMLSPLITNPNLYTHPLCLLYILLSQNCAIYLSLSFKILKTLQKQ